MQKLNYCYHSHTKRCNHAIGEDEEYVKAAIKAGIKYMGFSDHIFLPNVSQPRVRGQYCLLNEYIESVSNLKEKHKDKIHIKIGFEAEYLPSFISYYESLLKTKKIDYLIQGQHYHEYSDGIKRYPDNDVDLYVDDVISGIKTGLFTYLCHPDIFMLWNDIKDKKTIEAARRLLKACEEYKIPIEYNMCGVRDKRAYPCKKFFILSKEYNLEYVIGIDAHAPEHYNKKDINKALRFFKNQGLKLKELIIK